MVFIKSDNQKNIQNANQCNILVVGPNKSGKTSLLKTMHFALNGSWQNPEQSKNMDTFIIKKIQIKKSKKHVVQGLTKVKETDHKKTVTGYQIQSTQVLKSNKYSKALQLIDNKIISCIKQMPFNPFKNSQIMKQTNIRVCLICMHIINQTDSEQLNWIRFFIADLKQKHIKTFIILTHQDTLLKMGQKDRLQFQDQRISKLMKQVGINDRSDIICMENYKIFKQGYTKNCQKINYYFLKLLQKCLKQGQNYQKYVVKGKKSLKGFFCG